MRPTYENVYIGTFIFSLGYMFGAKNNGRQASVAIELYQQTPAGERLVGDLLTSVDGKCIIVEFKRDIAGIPKELEKQSKALLRRELQSGNDARFLEISRRCHYIAIASKYSDTHTRCLAFLPYVDLVTQDQTAWQWVSDATFGQGYISFESSVFGVSGEDFDYYIRELAKVAGGSCGGLAVSVDADGLRSAVVFEDVRELRMKIAEAEQAAEPDRSRLEPSRSDPSCG